MILHAFRKRLAEELDKIPTDAERALESNAVTTAVLARRLLEHLAIDDLSVPNGFRDDPPEYPLGTVLDRILHFGVGGQATARYVHLTRASVYDAAFRVAESIAENMIWLSAWEAVVRLLTHALEPTYIGLTDYLFVLGDIKRRFGMTSSPVKLRLSLAPVSSSWQPFSINLFKNVVPT